VRRDASAIAGERNFANRGVSDRLPLMRPTPPIVLTIAGFDPSSGAGVTADIKTIAAHGCYGISCITALTVQSTAAVRRVEPVDAELVRKTLEELVADVEVAAVKIGMLGAEAVVHAVADFLLKADLPNVVLDPILESSSGADLLDRAGVTALIKKLLPLADVVTPNLSEAGALTGSRLTGLEQMRGAAAKLHSLGSKAVVVTGGALDPAIELLSFIREQRVEQEVFKSSQQQSKSTHGTGCAFATAIACHLAHGRGLPEAVLLAKAYVSAAIAKAYPLGRGVGPVHHLYRMDEERKVRIVRDPETAH
jgi:hydroxymethylpyrimidine/phosphomethylpyrimidine kinase